VCNQSMGAMDRPSAGLTTTLSSMTVIIGAAHLSKMVLCTHIKVGILAHLIVASFVIAKVTP
jgi:hypothetical protein